MCGFWTFVFGNVRCCCGTICCFGAFFVFCAGFVTSACSTGSTGWAAKARAQQQAVRSAISVFILVPSLNPFSFNSFAERRLRVSGAQQTPNAKCRKREKKEDRE